MSTAFDTDVVGQPSETFIPVSVSDIGELNREVKDHRIFLWLVAEAEHEWFLHAGEYDAVYADELFASRVFHLLHEGYGL